jgi:hypothetical protein
MCFLSDYKRGRRNSVGLNGLNLEGKGQAREREREPDAKKPDIAEEPLTDRADAAHLALICLAKMFANVLFR